MAKSVSLQRHVQAYLTPKLHPVFIGYTLIEKVGKSELINEALAYFFRTANPEKLKVYRIAAKQFELDKEAFEKGNNLV